MGVMVEWASSGWTRNEMLRKARKDLLAEWVGDGWVTTRISRRVTCEGTEAKAGDWTRRRVLVAKAATRGEGLQSRRSLH